jgi:AcrR family transcriptional regulator
VARTLNPAVHAVRREVFVDVAQRLVTTNGYERVSVQDVLDGADSSRGAFYHYFDGKAALLDAVIVRMVEQAWAMLASIVDDPELTAVEKLDGLFSGLAEFKAERRELVLRIIETWRSDDNAIVREKFRRATIGRLSPLLGTIIRQGIDEGSFDSSDPDPLAAVLAALVMGANEAAFDLYVARQAGDIELSEVERRLAAFSNAFERLLGLRQGSLPLANPEVIHQWYS